MLRVLELVLVVTAFTVKASDGQNDTTVRSPPYNYETSTSASSSSSLSPPKCPKIENCQIRNSSSSSATLRWDCCEGHSGVTYTYKVTPVFASVNETCNCSAETKMKHTDKCSLTLNDLCSYTNYSIVVDHSEGLASCEVSFKTSPSAPSQVRKLEIEALSDSEVFLTWTPPECLNGDDVIYFIEQKDLRILHLYETEKRISGLLPKKEYIFNVQACNSPDKNLCADSVEQKVTTKAGGPSAPTNFQVTAINSSALLLTWKEPEKLGGDSVDGYQIFCYETMHPEVEVLPNVSLSALRLEVAENLRPGESYTCIIRAYHNTSEGILFGEKNSDTATTSPEAPSEPINLKVENVTSNSVTLTWEMPENPNGPLDGFEVSIRKTQQMESAKYNYVPAVFTHNVDELEPWTEYNFTVSAYNYQNGTGSERLISDPVHVVNTTAPAEPSAPSNFTVKALNSSAIELTWNMPDNPRGSIDHYNIVCQTDESFTVDNVTSYDPEERNRVVTGLDPWTNYTCLIWAVNVNLTNFPIPGNASRGTTKTWPEEPSEPTNLTIVNEPFSSVTLTWDEPETLRGPLDGYEVSWKKVEDTDEVFANNTFVSENTSAVIHVLQPWTEYNFTIAAFNKKYGDKTVRLKGDVVHDVIRTRPTYPGGPPTEVSITNLTAFSMTVTWNDPDVKNGPISGYLLTLTEKETNISNELTVIVKNEAFCHDLKPYTLYVVSICAYNDDQKDGPLFGTCDISTNQTWVAAPSKPSHLVLHQVAARFVALLWNRPSQLNGPLDGYILEWGVIDADTNITVSWENVTLQNKAAMVHYRLDRVLIPYTKYTFRVSAFNVLFIMDEKREHQVGDYAEIRCRTRVAAPSSPEFLSVGNVSDNYVDITWQPPKEPNGEVNGYEVEVTDSECLKSSTDVPDFHRCGEKNVTANTAFRVENLKPWTNYVLKVMAFNKQSMNDPLFSKPVEITTKTLPGIPDYPISNLTKIRAENAQIQFMLPMDIFHERQGPIVNYAVIVAQVNTINSTTNRQNGKKREKMKSWSDVVSTTVVMPYQTSPDFWDPYSTSEPELDPLRCENYTYSKNDGTTVVGRKCTVGSQTNCKQVEEYCNGPLRSELNYTVKIRGFTEGGWSETFPLQVFILSTQEAGNPSGVAVGVSVTVVFLLVAILVTTFVIRKKGLWPPKMLRTARPFTAKMDDVTTIATIQPKSKIVKVEEFADHVALMLSDSGLKFSEEFEELAAASPKHPWNVAELPGNKHKNRYTNILPFDHSRVKLLPIPDDQDSDYINGSYIPGNASRREYIATQGPLPATKDDFWKMVWEQNVSMVVMVTLCLERGKAKCEQYWRDDWEPHYHGDCLKVVKISESVLSAYTIRIFDIQMGGQQRSVKHMHFTKWPDFGCPESPEILINFVRAVRDHLPHSKPGPILVHCSAGVGRTGTFIAVDRLMQQVRERSEHLDVYRMVMEMRDHRCCMVQTEDQYIYIHECVREIIREETERTETPVPDGYEIYSNLNFKEE